MLLPHDFLHVAAINHIPRQPAFSMLVKEHSQTASDPQLMQLLHYLMLLRKTPQGTSLSEHNLWPADLKQSFPKNKSPPFLLTQPALGRDGKCRLKSCACTNSGRGKGCRIWQHTPSHAALLDMESCPAHPPLSWLKDCSLMPSFVEERSLPMPSNSDGHKGVPQQATTKGDAPGLQSSALAYEQEAPVR